MVVSAFRRFIVCPPVDRLKSGFQAKLFHHRPVYVLYHAMIIRSIEGYMDETTPKRLNRDDWLREALTLLETGVENVKVAPLAADMGVTTGSFYWHFENRGELLESLLSYWERELTDSAIYAAKQYIGSPTDRILFLMESVTAGNLARYDLSIWLWAQSDINARRIFKRVLKKRFSFAAWMFSEAGFFPRAGKHSRPNDGHLHDGRIYTRPGYHGETHGFSKTKALDFDTAGTMKRGIS